MPDRVSQRSLHQIDPSIFLPASFVDLHQNAGRAQSKDLEVFVFPMTRGHELCALLAATYWRNYCSIRNLSDLLALIHPHMTVSALYTNCWLESRARNMLGGKALLWIFLLFVFQNEPSCNWLKFLSEKLSAWESHKPNMSPGYDLVPFVLWKSHENVLYSSKSLALQLFRDGSALCWCCVTSLLPKQKIL